ncbi:slipin family protein [Myxococcota bacterium]|nr:slipin family protein [Myxococcota bacterium]MBU1897941.1 slipin family protein [Myxococcota bacterium]
MPKFKIELHERAVALRDGLPERFLGPGEHRLGGLWGVAYTLERFDTRQPLFEASPPIRALLPKDSFAEIRVGERERGVLYREGHPIKRLEPGYHRYWRLDPTVEVKLISLDEAPPRSAAVRALLDKDSWAEVTVGDDERVILYKNAQPQSVLQPGFYRYWTLEPTLELKRLSVLEPLIEDERVLNLLPNDQVTRALIAQHQRGLLYRQGRFEQVLDPGRYAFWSTPKAPTSIRVLDMRRQMLAVSGQELMTLDKVTLRMSLMAEWRPLDPATHAHIAAEPKELLYSMIQLAVRDYVASQTLDQLLEGRDALTKYLLERTRPEAAPVGIEVQRVGLKDIILPGEMKLLFNQVIEAEKRATANVILRREEAAATRVMANAAQLMAERPTLMRLKELETLKEIASQIDKIQVVIGGDQIKGLLPSLKASSADDRG